MYACLTHTPAKGALILTDAEQDNESAGLSQGPFHNLFEFITQNLKTEFRHTTVRKAYK